MKKNDIAVIILIVSVCGGIAYFAGQSLLGGLKKGTATVQVVEPITGTIAEPSNKVFNADAINPSVSIKIGESNNKQPFAN